MRVDGLGFKVCVWMARGLKVQGGVWRVLGLGRKAGKRLRV